MNSSRLFTASCVALIVTSMSFALRGAVLGDWVTQYHLTNEQAGWINGTAFWGFTLAMIFGGPLCDALGLGRIVGIAFVGHVVGIVLTICAWNFWSLYIGTLVFGIANGSVEAACNPLIATIYSTDKTTKLNHFHSWFPGGLVIGSVLAYFMARADLGWKVQFATMLVPTAIYGLLFLRQPFPRTERVQQGVSTGSMFASCLNPWFLVMVFCMLLTAPTELASEQWLPNVLNKAGASGVLALAWIGVIMTVGRQCAGTLVHRISPLGTLLFSAALSGLGLYTMGRFTGGTLFVSATILGLGVCFFWPTLLGYISENFSKTGALGLAIMGGAGMLSVNFALPLIGKSYDRGIALRLPAGHTAVDMTAAPGGSPLASQWMGIQADAGLHTLARVAVLPAVVFVVFLFLWVVRRNHRPELATGADVETVKL